MPPAPGAAIWRGADKLPPLREKAQAFHRGHLAQAVNRSLAWLPINLAAIEVMMRRVKRIALPWVLRL